MADLWEDRREQHERLQAEERARQQRIFQAGPSPSSPPAISARRSLSDRPVLLSAALGSTGGIAGVIVGAILSILIPPLLGETVMIGAYSPEYGDAMGYLLGVYCLIMFPCGGALVGALPGAMLGALRAVRERNVNPLHPLLAGMLTTTLMAIAGSVAVLFLVW